MQCKVLFHYKCVALLGNPAKCRGGNEIADAISRLLLKYNIRYKIIQFNFYELKYYAYFLIAASTTCPTSTEVVTLPTPPGTGVIASTIGSTAA